MKDFLFAVFCIGFGIIGLILAVDCAIQVKHRINGTPTDKRMWEHMIAKSNQTIESQATAIKTQAETIRQLKKRIKELSTGEEPCIQKKN